MHIFNGFVKNGSEYLSVMEKVKKLDEKATKAIYDHILSKLSSSSCQTTQSNSGGGARSVTKKQKLDPSVAVEEISKELDEYLVGPVYSQYRRQLWKEYKNHLQFNTGNYPDLFLFLDCVLDNTYKNLVFRPAIILPRAPQRANYPIKSMDLIAKRCPLLPSFTLLMGKWKPTVDLEIEFAKSFSNLKNLTKLHIGWDIPANGSDCISFFTHLGKSCPQMK